MVEVRDDMPALNISCNIIGSMISQRSFLLLLLTSSHWWSVEELVDGWRRVSSNLRFQLHTLLIHYHSYDYWLFWNAGSPFHHQKNRETIWKNHQSKAAKRSTVHNPYGQRGAVHLLKSWWRGCSGWFKYVSWRLFLNWSYLFRQLNIQVLYSWREVWVLLGIQYNWALENNWNIFWILWKKG